MSVATTIDPERFWALPKPQQDRLVAEIKERFGLDPEEVAEAYLDDRGSVRGVARLVKDENGQVVVEYQNRRETLNATTETAITTALQRLSYGGEQWVVFLEGHGERSISDGGPTSISRFAQVLRDKGLKVQGLSLVKNPRIPDNAKIGRAHV